MLLTLQRYPEGLGVIKSRIAKVGVRPQSLAYGEHLARVVTSIALRAVVGLWGNYTTKQGRSSPFQGQ